MRFRVFWETNRFHLSLSSRFSQSSGIPSRSSLNIDFLARPKPHCERSFLSERQSFARPTVNNFGTYFVQPLDILADPLPISCVSAEKVCNPFLQLVRLARLGNSYMPSRVTATSSTLSCSANCPVRESAPDSRAAKRAIFLKRALCRVLKASSASSTPAGLIIGFSLKPSSPPTDHVPSTPNSISTDPRAGQPTSRCDWTCLRAALPAPRDSRR